MWKRVAVWVGKNVVMRFYSLVGRLFLWPILYMEYRYQKPAGRAGCNERPVEYLFALKWLTRLCPREVLDVGCGRSAWPEIVAKCGFHVTAIDKIRGYWRGDFFNRHYYVQNQDVTRPTLTREFDFITCLSVLEHIPDHHAAMEGMFRLLKPGGHLVLSFPYNEETYVDNIYQRPGVGYGQDYSFICQVYSRQQIDEWLRSGRGRLVDQAYYEVFTGDLWAFGERICPPREVEKGHKCHLTCLVIQRT